MLLVLGEAFAESQLRLGENVSSLFNEPCGCSVESGEGACLSHASAVTTCFDVSAGRSAVLSERLLESVTVLDRSATSLTKTTTVDSDVRVAA